MRIIAQYPGRLWTGNLPPVYSYVLSRTRFDAAPDSLGKYRIFKRIAAGGMATVHVGCLRGPGGFVRNVAIKRLHPQYAKDSEFVALFMQEAQLSARINHPNVLPTLDVIAQGDELYLVMDYVHGDSLARLSRFGLVEPELASGIMVQVLLGLHAAHEARDSEGTPLGIVHRDVSPHNILVDENGVARLVDFGIAKAVSSVSSTEAGKVRGKAAYLAPEQLEGTAQDRQVDIFAAGIVLFELVTGRRLFGGGDTAGIMARLLQWDAAEANFEGMPEPLRAIARCALARAPEARYATAREMAIALGAAVPPASGMQIAEWLNARAGDVLAERAAIIAAMDRVSSSEPPPRELSPVSLSDHPSLAPAKGTESAWSRWGSLAAMLVCLASLAVALLLRNVRTLDLPAPGVNAAPAEIAQNQPILADSALAQAGRAVPSAAIPVVRAEQLPSEARAVAPARPAVTHRSRPECRVPFTIDTAGMKHFKVECYR